MTTIEPTTPAAPPADDESPVTAEALAGLDDAVGAEGAAAPGDPDPEAAAAQVVGELEQLDTFELLDMVLEGAHETFAPAWPIKPKQRQAVARAWSKWADKVLPGYLARYGDLAVAVTVTAMVIGPHANKPRFAPVSDASA